MTELGVKGTVLGGTGGSMRLTLLDCTNGQASRGPEREEGKKKMDSQHQYIYGQYILSPQPSIRPWEFKMK